MQRSVVTILRYGGATSLAVWLAGVSGAFGPTVNWTALVVGVALIALGRIPPGGP